MSIIENITQFIQQEFIPEDYDLTINEDTDLIQVGVLDSLGVLKLVAFVEERFDVTLEPEEIDPENLKSIKTISELLRSKEIA